jgi:hypothetical protein
MAKLTYGVQEALKILWRCATLLQVSEATNLMGGSQEFIEGLSAVLHHTNFMLLHEGKIDLMSYNNINHDITVITMYFNHEFPEFSQFVTY